MFNFRIVAKVLSEALIASGLFMFLSAIISFLYKDTCGALILSGIFTLIAGGMVYAPLKREEKVYGKREGFLIVSGIWIVYGITGTLPYLISGTIPNVIDAFFESMSGFTTTGASIIQNLELCSHGILFWRSASQWIGGITFILLTLSIIPLKQINIQLSLSEFTGLPADKFNPRTGNVSRTLILTYAALTFAETILLSIGDMNFFDALCYSMSTISTGGFSNHAGSVSSLNSPYLLIVITIFMFLAGANTTLIYYGAIKRFDKIKENSEFWLYCSFIIVFIIAGSIALTVNHTYGFGKSVYESAFQVTSMVSTTGFYNSNYNTWGGFMMFSLIVMMVIGASSGSAGSGMKSIRFLIIGKIIHRETKAAIHPDAIIPIRLYGKAIPFNMLGNILVYLLLYLLTILVGSAVIATFDIDLMSSFSTTISMVSNVGNAPGTFGPFTTYADLAPSCKLFMTFLMLLGRIELFSILILFSVGFYKR